MKKNLVISTVAAIAAINPEFQFHKGAIRTEGPDPLPYRDDEFQFHKGAIRTVFSA